MSELLAPAGTIEAFYAAISSGANAIYLGLDKYSARAYADNFTLDKLKELLDFAHLRNVRIFVTINTIIYEKELEEVYRTIDALAEMGVDAIIVQDLAVATYIINNYISLEAHASTQMGIDDMEAAKLAKDLGFKRIVFARETSLEVIKQIKSDLNIEVEAFIHGALCVSYSGNCYMSSSIGERSGNRGRCAGCCRKKYTLVDTRKNKEIETGYLLSMKDLNVSSNIKEMPFVDSFKIEGRMKEPEYVAGVTNIYRRILDKENVDITSLNRVFNRTYTKGFMLSETSKEITNIEKPNNFGYLIGTIVKQNKNTIWIKLNKPLNKGDQIRIESANKFEEISVPVCKIFDASFNEIESANKIAICSCNKLVRVGAKVYKTKDIKFIEEINKSIEKKEYKKIPINMEFVAHQNKPIILKVNYQNFKVFVKSNILIEEAKTSATTKENIYTQLSKLNDTPYALNKLNIEMEENLFIPLKEINELRRNAIIKLNELRLTNKVKKCAKSDILPNNCAEITPEITVEVNNEEQFLVAKEAGIKHIYFKNIIRRNNAKYIPIEGEVLVGGLGGINHYKNTNEIISDASLNVTNSTSVATLSGLGVSRITLSEEISKENIIDLINSYKAKYNTIPNLEMIVYGRSKIMHTKYCPFKRLNMCGRCKDSTFALQDDFESFPIRFNDDCTINLFNAKKLNLMDDISSLKGINYYRLNFTDENKEEVKEIIETFKAKLEGRSKQITFNKLSHTRGHFYSSPL